MYFDERAPSLDSGGPNRRKTRPSVAGGWLLSMVVLAMTSVCRPLGSIAAESARVTLQAQAAAGDSLTYRVALEAQGQLRWKAPEKGERQAKVNILGEQTYHERLLEVSAEPAQTRAVRHYVEAKVVYQIGSQRRERQLDESRRLLLATLADHHLTIASPVEPLTRDDLDLLDVPGCSLALGAVLPDNPVQIGQSWQPSGEALAALLGLTSTAETDVTATLRKVEKGVALIELRGKVSGRVDGANTKISLEGKLNFDTGSRTITWFAASIHEQREISDTQPGLDVTARLRLVGQRRAAPPAELADAALPAQIKEAAALAQLVRYAGRDAGLELLYDRQWRIIVERHDVIIMRCFDDDRLLAQVVITPLPDGPPGKNLGLRPFEEEVLAALQENSGQIVESAEGAGEDGLTVLRVVAAGVVSEVSMQWVHYHVSNEQGRRAGLTFTVQTDLLEQFAERDRAMVETFQFRARPDRPTTDGAPATEPPAVEAAQKATTAR